MSISMLGNLVSVLIRVSPIAGYERPMWSVYFNSEPHLQIFQIFKFSNHFPAYPNTSITSFTC